MQCPACSNELSRVDVNEIEVDVCKGGCGGVWFDGYEFKKFDEPHEHAGVDLLDVEIDPNTRVDHSKKRNCPRCENITMMRHYFSVKKEVEVDECGGCAGIWLDAGELAHIRSLFNSEEERKEAAKNVFADLFGAQIESIQSDREQNLKKTRRMANMFNFI